MVLFRQFLSRQRSGAEDVRSEVADVTDSYRLCQIHPLEFVDLSEQWFSAPKRGGALPTQNIFAWGVGGATGPHCSAAYVLDLFFFHCF